MSLRRLRVQDYTVGWFSALPIELAAATVMLDEKHESLPYDDNDPNLYTLGSIGKHNVVLACLPAGQIGTNSAAAVATRMQSNFPSLRVGLMVGIGGGVPSAEADIRLGDVVISQPHAGRGGVVQYDSGTTGVGGRLTPTSFLNTPPTVLLSAISQLQSDRYRGQDALSKHFIAFEELTQFSRDSTGPDVLYEATYNHIGGPTCDGCREDKTKKRIQRASQKVVIHYGTIASGNQVIKDGVTRDRLSAERGGVLCFEMEAAGLMNSFPCLVIRGICDYADSHKNKKWQPYAAAVAAACAKEVLLLVPASETSTPCIEGETTRRKEACLHSLSFSNIDDRRHNIALAHQDTCDWLFATAQFQQWRDRSDLLTHNGVLWIKGKPGAGKSTLMKHTLLYCERTFTDHIIAVYFFNARGNELEKTPLGMLRSLLYQLLDQDPYLCERFIPMFLDKQKKHEKGWEWQVGELKSFLLSEIKRFQPKCLILIDALDECNESEVREVVAFLELLSMNAVGAKTNLNICLSSRHYPNINMEKRLELNMEYEKGHDQDIVKYARYKLRIRDKEIEKELLQKAEHVFMWVVLVVEMLNQAFDHGKVRAMQKKLREVPGDLDQVFWTLLNKDNSDKQETILILQWVLFARRLLTPEELYFAVLAGTGPEELGAWNRSRDTSEMIKRFITSTSKGLIEVHKGDTETIQFIHGSVKDFLLRNKRLQTLDPTLKPDAIGASHDRLAACCMSYITMKELAPLEAGRSYTKTELAFNYPLLEYVSTYVLYHAEKAQLGCIAQHALVQQLLQQPHREFERLRSFHDSFQRHAMKYGMGAGLLYVLSFHGYYELVQMVLLEKGDEVNAQGGGSYGTALQAASARGHDQIVQRLLEKGANVNAQGGLYGTALQAASARGHDQIVQWLLEKGPDVNAQGGRYGTALRAASALGHDQIVQRLLEKGADVNVQGGHYGTALQAASVEGDDRIVQRLLEKGADVNVQGGRYGTALQAASARGDNRIVQRLLEKGADVNVQGGRYGTALQAASARGDDQIVQRLLEMGADVNAQGGDHGTALQAASAQGHAQIVQWLLEKGANVNAQGGLYGTALQAASAQGHAQIVQWLLEKGANVNAQGGRYGTALLAASARGHDQIVQRLLEMGQPLHPP